MATSMPPLQLGAGIFFENSRQLLKWGCTRAEALAVPGATHHKDDDTHIQWKVEIFGLPCGVAAYLPGDTKLDSVDIWLRQNEYGYRTGAHYEYCCFFDQLLRAYGQPHCHWGAPQLAPILTWEKYDCFVQLYLGEKMDEYTLLQITHGRPPRYQAR